MNSKTYSQKFKKNNLNLEIIDADPNELTNENDDNRNNSNNHITQSDTDYKRITLEPLKSS